MFHFIDWDCWSSLQKLKVTHYRVDSPNILHLSRYKQLHLSNADQKFVIIICLTIRFFSVIESIIFHESERLIVSSEVLLWFVITYSSKTLFSKRKFSIDESRSLWKANFWLTRSGLMFSTYQPVPSSSFLPASAPPVLLTGSLFLFRFKMRE